MSNDDLMPTNHDRWGEQIRQERRTFTLAALFRSMTLTAIAAAWIVAISHSRTFAPLALVIVAMLLSAVVAHRQAGKTMSKVAAFLGCFVGVIFVGGFVPSVLGMLSQHDRVDYQSAWGALDATYSSCLTILAFPAVVFVAVQLVRAWVYLANVAADSGGIPQGGGNECVADRFTQAKAGD